MITATGVSFRPTSFSNPKVRTASFNTSVGNMLKQTGKSESGMMHQFSYLRTTFRQNNQQQYNFTQKRFFEEGSWEDSPIKDKAKAPRRRDRLAIYPGRFRHRLLLNVGRHTKVTKGGRIFSISVLLILGDGKGTGGMGYGKAETFKQAMQNAVMDAQKKAFTINLYEGRTISTPAIHKFRKSIMYVWPLPLDRGMLCNNTFRRIATCFGIKDIRIKSQGSRNPHSMYRCLVDVFKMSETEEQIAQKRGLKSFDFNKAIRVQGRDRAF